MTTRNRAYINCKLNGSAESFAAMAAIALWKRTRDATYHITRAIRMYDGLLKGDASLLYEFFPLLGLVPGRHPPAARPATPSGQAIAMAIDDTQALDDLLGTFGDELEF